MNGTIRPTEYPGSTPYEPYTCTPEMLRHKADIILCDTGGLNQWALEWRQGMARRLNAKAWVMEKEEAIS